MMPLELTVVAFAQARDSFGFATRTVPYHPDETPRRLLARVAPGVDLAGLAVAVDEEYAPLDAPIGQARELALIPPVSGG